MCRWLVNMLVTNFLRKFLNEGKRNLSVENELLGCFKRWWLVLWSKHLYIATYSVLLLENIAEGVGKKMRGMKLVYLMFRYKYMRSKARNNEMERKNISEFLKCIKMKYDLWSVLKQKINKRETNTVLEQNLKAFW